MTETIMDVEKAYANVVRAFAAEAGVAVGAKGKKGFGSNALRINDKIFAMISSKGAFVVKLPRVRVDELVAAGKGQRFNPGHGRIMKEWLEVDATFQGDWIKLAKEAKSFVAGKS